MKFKLLLIGIMLVLALCISPVVAVSADDFYITIDRCGDGMLYTYFNQNDLDEEYIQIYTYGTLWLYSYVTFKPANIPDAPKMVVDTSYRERYFLLPKSVDDWEIKYYSRTDPLYHLTDKWLKNSGVVNLNKRFGKYIPNELILELSTGQYIFHLEHRFDRYCIPSVDR